MIFLAFFSSFSLSYRGILPSSFKKILSNALVFSTYISVSIWGTVEQPTAPPLFRKGGRGPTELRSGGELFFFLEKEHSLYQLGPTYGGAAIGYTLSFFPYLSWGAKGRNPFFEWTTMKFYSLVFLIEKPFRVFS